MSPRSTSRQNVRSRGDQVCPRGSSVTCELWAGSPNALLPKIPKIWLNLQTWTPNFFIFQVVSELLHAVPVSVQPILDQHRPLPRHESSLYTPKDNQCHSYTKVGGCRLVVSFDSCRYSSCMVASTQWWGYGFPLLKTTLSLKSTEENIPAFLVNRVS